MDPRNFTEPLDPADWFSQTGYDVRLEWGRRGARAAAARGDVLVVVDVLSFATLAAVAASRGVTLYPCATAEEAEETGARVGARVAERSRTAPAPGRYSLSPATFLPAPRGEKVALPSPNGATCCRLGRAAPALFVGALVNAAATATAAARAAGPDGAITLLACGERWAEPSEDGPLRFAVEDYLGAGAVAAHLPAGLSRSPEARAAEAAFLAAAPDLEATLLGCGSGIELVRRGFPDDVRLAARLNLFDAVPTQVDGERLEAA